MAKKRIRIPLERSTKAPERDPAAKTVRIRLPGAGETTAAPKKKKQNQVLKSKNGKTPTAKEPRVRLNKNNDKSGNTDLKPVRAENEKISEAADKVGYGNPPRHTQFAKNDGRPRRGRPKGSKNIATLVVEAAAAQITVTIDGKKRKISKAQSAAIQLANAGAMGDPKLLLKFIDLIASIEARAEAARPSEYPFNEMDKQVIREIYKRLRPYEERGSA